MTNIKSFFKYFGYFLEKTGFTMAYLFFFVIMVQFFFNLDTDPIIIPRRLFTWVSGISICLSLFITVRDKMLKVSK